MSNKADNTSHDRSLARLTTGPTHEGTVPGGFGPLAVSRENEPEGKRRSEKVMLTDFATQAQRLPSGTKRQASEKAVSHQMDEKDVWPQVNLL